MTAHIQISVRNLVEHLLRRGDLTSGFDELGRTGPMSGIRGHQKIQKSRPASYAREVAIQCEAESGPYSLAIHGRIDGIYEQKGKIIIEEIKTTHKSLDSFIRNNQDLHWAQVRVYAAIIAIKQKLPGLTLQLTYLKADTGEIRTYFRHEAISELDSFLQEIIDLYVDWIKKIDTQKRLRNQTVSASEFPYPAPRPGQTRMMEEVYNTIFCSGQALIQAPTGTGKTAAAIFPSLKALAEGQIDQIFYLTARTTGQFIAEKTLNEMRTKGLSIKFISLTAKEKICFNPDKNCNGEECQYARGYYDRLPEAREALFEQEEFNREKLSALAEEHRLCPFELSLDLAPWVDIIICDYNYAFDPRVYLKRFFLENQMKCVFLVDEAHNLVDRGREMFSAPLDKSRFLELRLHLKNKKSQVFQLAGKINTWLREKKKQISPEIYSWDKERPDRLLSLLRKLCTALEKEHTAQSSPSLKRIIMQHYFESLWFQRVADLFDDNYAVCYEANKRNFSIKQFCIDPSRQLRAAFERAQAAVLFSATLTPMPYFSQILGLNADVEQCTLPSPFPQENLHVMTTGLVSTYYRHRRATSSALAQTIGTFTESKSGNYLVFFPSYVYMQMVKPLYLRAFPHHQVLTQTHGMDEDERGSFLASFAHENNCTLVGFVVMGGIFGEAIDLMGDRLSGAAIVGVGLPGISLERELIRNHFDQENMSGFNYAYLYPGMIRVLQAAGRVIRSESDRGAVLLIDPRYDRPQYYELFPPEWEVRSARTPDDTARLLQDFWNGRI